MGPLKYAESTSLFHACVAKIEGSKLFSKPISMQVHVARDLPGLAYVYLRHAPFCTPPPKFVLRAPLRVFVGV